MFWWTNCPNTFFPNRMGTRHLGSPQTISRFGPNQHWTYWQKHKARKFLAFALFFAYPPHALLNQVLRKVALEKVILILIAPQWTRRDWYPLLLDPIVDFPYRLPVLRNLVTQEQGTLFHAKPAKLSLKECPHCARTFLEVLQKHAFQQKLQPPKRTTNLAGTIFVPGVQRRISIPIIPLSLS